MRMLAHAATGYLTPMHELVIVSTFFTVAAAVESVIAHMLQKRVAMREAVLQKLPACLNTCPNACLHTTATSIPETYAADPTLSISFEMFHAHCSLCFAHANRSMR